MKRIHLPILGALCLIVLTGCSSNRQLEPMELTFSDVDATNEAVVAALEKLTESAAISAEANKLIADLENGKAYITMSSDEYEDYLKRTTTIPLGMEVEFDVNYSGPLTPLLQSLASTSGYELALPATRPVRDLFVDMNTLTNPVTGKKNSNVKNVYDAVLAVNSVHKDRIKLTIHETHRILELEYK